MAGELAFRSAATLRRLLAKGLYPLDHRGPDFPGGPSVAWFARAVLATRMPNILGDRLGVLLRKLLSVATPGARGGTQQTATDRPAEPAEGVYVGQAAPIPPPPEPPEGVAVPRHGSAELLDLISGERATTVLQPGQILFKEGDLGSTMYIVRSGVLRIRSGSVVYEDVAAGGVVGEMGLVEMHMPRSATVYALQSTELVEIDEHRFDKLVERRPSFAITVMRILSRRLRYMDRRYRLEG